MKARITLILLGMLFPSFVFSGEIYGIIRENGKSVGKEDYIKIVNCNMAICKTFQALQETLLQIG